MKVPILTIDGLNIPTGEVLSIPLRLTLESEFAGNLLVSIRLGTRHFCTELPLNERVSHRLSMEWLVICARSGKVITSIAQSEHSYHHLDFFVSFPAEKNLILVPNSPYICDNRPSIEYTVSESGLGVHTYRYEVELGNSTDSELIGDCWSYREGHLPFMHWFHNKAFRWAFDGAQLRLPVAKNRVARISINALCRTFVDVIIQGVKVTTLAPISDSSRWHDERYGVIVPAELVSSDVLEVEFRFVQDAINAIDFNLRQPSFAVSRLIVDIFDGNDTTLFERVATAAWAENKSGVGLSFIPCLMQEISNRSALVATQAMLLIAEVEFEIVSRYFSPHSSFWNSIRGLHGTAQRNGVSITLASHKYAAESGRLYESVVLGPIRYDSREVDRLRDLPGGFTGAVLAPTVPSLALFGLTLDSKLLEEFSYREIYDVPFTSDTLGNFWEILPKESIAWEEVYVLASDAVIIGRRPNSDTKWLVTASSEDWFEMGDPGAGYVLDQFFNLIASVNYLSLDNVPCSVSVTEAGLQIATFENRSAIRSYGGGIARGWAPIKCDFLLFESREFSVYLNNARAPVRGVVAIEVQKLDNMHKLLMCAGDVKTINIKNETGL